jgi:tRNA nucleotidyltransferase (CCA-adding enzyme)
VSPEGGGDGAANGVARDGGRARPAGAVELNPPAAVRRIVQLLEEAGFSTWAVGGAVRDAFAGNPPGDWDLTTAARPRDVRRLFRRTVPIGIDHGTVGVIGEDRRMVEVTTFRRDVETFGRHAVVAFADTLEEDLQRRDFTINAVAWHPLTGEVRDPHGGVPDLRERVLRTVGAPAERFAEDRLRVLRALRFAGRFRLRIDDATWAAAAATAPALHELSAERVREELLKVLREIDRPSLSLRLYQECGALRFLYPELEACVGVADRGGTDVWSHLLASADELPRYRPLLRLAALLHDAGKPAVVEGEDGEPTFPRHAEAGAALARGLMRRLKASNADADRITHLVAHHHGLPEPDAPDPAFRRWAALVGREHVRDLVRLRLADRCARGDRVRETIASARRLRAVLHRHPPLTLAELAIDGADLRRIGIKPGPRFGEILKALLDRVLEVPSLNQPEELLRIVEEEMGG